MNKKLQVILIGLVVVSLIVVVMNILISQQEESRVSPAAIKEDIQPAKVVDTIESEELDIPDFSDSEYEIDVIPEETSDGPMLLN